MNGFVSCATGAVSVGSGVGVSEAVGDGVTSGLGVAGALVVVVVSFGLGTAPTSVLLHAVSALSDARAAPPARNFFHVGILWFFESLGFSARGAITLGILSLAVPEYYGNLTARMLALITLYHRFD